MIISVQVLQELYVVLTKKMGISAEDAERVIKNYARLPVVITDSTLVLQGIEISRRNKISFWDSMVVAAALRGDCRLTLPRLKPWDSRFSEGRLVDLVDARSAAVALSTGVTSRRPGGTIA